MSNKGLCCHGTASALLMVVRGWVVDDEGVNASKEGSMKASAIRIGSAALVFLALAAVPAAAQSNVRVRGRVSVRVGPVRGDVVVGTPYRRVPVRRTIDYRGRRYGDRNARYCNDGYGHPQGWGWCVDAGYLQPYFRLGRWMARYDHRVAFRYGNRPGRSARGYLDEHDLTRLLGRRAVDRLRDHRRLLGIYGRMHGEWVHLQRGGVALGVMVRDRAIAELRDQDHDGYVDVTFLATSGGRWYR
jgi:hypothetical protein